MRATDQPLWCGRPTSALAICARAWRWLAAAFIRLRLDISAPGGHPVNFGLSMLFVVLTSSSLGIGAHTVSIALTGSAVLSPEPPCRSRRAIGLSTGRLAPP